MSESKIYYSIREEEADAVAQGIYENIFGILGIHEVSHATWEVRSYLPLAQKMEVLDKSTHDVLARGENIGRTGVFCAQIFADKQVEYLIRATYETSKYIFEDPYRFGTTIGEQDLYLFGEGTHERAYNFLGAHCIEIEGVSGVRFAVWAPNAKRVSVVGDFNFWDGRRHVMRKHIPGGVWEIFIPGIEAGALYKYELLAADGSLLPHKADPFGFSAQRPP
jgi:1,4-alpha-glucan branching enzyme